MHIVGKIKQLLQKYKELQDVIAILSLEELSEEDRIIVDKVRKIKRFLSQFFSIVEVFTRIVEKYISLLVIISGFKRIVFGSIDSASEKSFHLKGSTCNIPPLP